MILMYRELVPMKGGKFAVGVGGIFVPEGGVKCRSWINKI